MALLSWSSFPVFVLALFVVIEALPFWWRVLRASKWWVAIAWFCRPWAVWAVFNIFYRIFASRGYNNRLTFPFYYDLWEEPVTLVGTIRRLALSPDFWIWSLVVAVLIVLFLLVCRWVMSGAAAPRKTALALGSLVILGFLLPLAFDCLPAGVGNPWQKKGSFGCMWIDAGNTMLYCLPFVQSKSYYLRHFEEIQPELKDTIHGADHPPGASLALYLLGKPFGAHKDIYHDWWRYELGMAAFASMSVLAMFFLGWSLFRSRQIGLMSAAMWAVKPTSLAYNVFAPDTVYWVFYILCLGLSWRVVVFATRPYFSMIGLGIVWAILSMLNFNFPLPIAMFGVFLLLHAYCKGRPAIEWLWRAILPASVAVILFLWVCLHYNLNYPAIFLYALKNFSFYHLNTVYRLMMALIGGQIDMFIMAGSLAGYIFLTRLPRWARAKPICAQFQYALVILGLYLVTVIVLKDLRNETARIWAWIMAAPMVLVANYVQSMENPRFWFLIIVTLSLLQYYVMRLMLVSAG